MNQKALCECSMWTQSLKLAIFNIFTCKSMGHYLLLLLSTEDSIICQVTVTSHNHVSPDVILRPVSTEDSIIFQVTVTSHNPVLPDVILRSVIY